MRLDAYLAQYWPDISRSQWQKYIDAGYVKVNGEIETSAKRLLGEDDIVAYDLPQKPDYSDQTLPLLHLDDNVIVINKPVGLLTHAKGAINDEFTVAEFFRRYSTYHADTNRPGIVHRLDRDTSGVMIGARNPQTGSLLSKQFSDRKVKKTYYAVVDGHPKASQAKIDLPIGRNPAAPSTFRVDPGGRIAVTDYMVVAKNHRQSLIKLQPLTGRTHQLRVHLAYLDTPIIGDKVYGTASDRLYLHAASLEITIPPGDRRTFTAPLPPGFLTNFPDVEV